MPVNSAFRANLGYTASKEGKEKNISLDLVSPPAFDPCA